MSAAFLLAAGDECEMVRLLLKPRIYLMSISSYFLIRVLRKRENSPQLVEEKVKLKGGHI